MRFEDRTIAGDGRGEQPIARQDRRRDGDLSFQLAGECRRDQRPQPLGRAQPPQPAQFRREPIERRRRSRPRPLPLRPAETAAASRRPVDELDKVDRGDAGDEEAEAGSATPKGESRSPARAAPGSAPERRQTEIEPARFVRSLRCADATASLPRLGIGGHARRSPSRKSSALSRLIWGTPSPAARSSRGGWNTGKLGEALAPKARRAAASSARSRERSGCAARRLRAIRSRRRPCGPRSRRCRPRCSGSRRAPRRRPAPARPRRAGWVPRPCSPSALRDGRAASAGTWSALVAAKRTRSMRAPNSRRSRLRRPKRKASRIGFERFALVGERFLAGVERAQHVDEHDLAVDAAGELRKERLARRPAYRPRTAPPSAAARLPGRACAPTANGTGQNHRTRRVGDCPGFKNRPGWQEAQLLARPARGQKIAVETVRPPCRFRVGRAFGRMARRESRASRGRAARAPRAALARRPRATSRHSSGAAAAGRAAIRRGSRGCRGRSSAVPPAARPIGLPRHNLPAKSAAKPRSGANRSCSAANAAGRRRARQRLAKRKRCHRLVLGRIQPGRDEAPLRRRPRRNGRRAGRPDRARTDCGPGW